MTFVHATRRLAAGLLTGVGIVAAPVAVVAAPPAAPDDANLSAPPALTYWIEPTPEVIDAFVAEVGTTNPEYVRLSLLGAGDLRAALLHDGELVCRRGEHGMEWPAPEHRDGATILADYYQINDADSPYAAFARLAIETFCPDMPALAEALSRGGHG
jgi:hypothetical protein